ncbi:MAG: hypothetical protein PUG30_06545 [Actinomycetaceae bacterium]|nr:hypothetical protein [Actinomycetaceae bacterium]
MPTDPYTSPSRNPFEGDEDILLPLDPLAENDNPVVDPSEPPSEHPSEQSAHKEDTADSPVTQAEPATPEHAARLEQTEGVEQGATPDATATSDEISETATQSLSVDHSNESDHSDDSAHTEGSLASSQDGSSADPTVPVHALITEDSASSSVNADNSPHTDAGTPAGGDAHADEDARTDADALAGDEASTAEPRTGLNNDSSDHGEQSMASPINAASASNMDQPSSTDLPANAQDPSSNPSPDPEPGTDTASQDLDTAHLNAVSPWPYEEKPQQPTYAPESAAAHSTLADAIGAGQYSESVDEGDATVPGGSPATQVLSTHAHTAGQHARVSSDATPATSTSPGSLPVGLDAADSATPADTSAVLATTPIATVAANTPTDQRGAYSAHDLGTINADDASVDGEGSIVPQKPKSRAWAHVLSVFVGILLAPLSALAIAASLGLLFYDSLEATLGNSTVEQLIDSASTGSLTIDNVPPRSWNAELIAILVVAIVILVLLWLNIRRSTLGAWISGVLLTGVGIFSVITPDLASTYIARPLERYISLGSNINTIVFGAFNILLTSGFFLFFGLILLMTAFAVHSGRRRASARERALAAYAAYSSENTPSDTSTQAITPESVTPESYA